MRPTSQHGIGGKTAVFIIAAARSIARLPGSEELRRPEVGQQSQGVDLGAFFIMRGEHDCSCDSIRCGIEVGPPQTNFQ